MLNNNSDIFSKLPLGFFKPLASTNQRLHWFSITRLYHAYFDDDTNLSELGSGKEAVISTILSVVEQNPNLWTSDPLSEDVIKTSRSRATHIYNQFRENGWLEESREGYHDYVSMPPRVSLCLSILIELSDGRALVMTGKLKSLRADMRESEKNPEDAADVLTESAKDAKRFARHLSSIRGSIKSLYENIRGDIPARDIVSSFFDDFLREILIRDYATIKTSENPLAIRSELLKIVQRLRYNKDIKSKLLNGYNKIYPSENNEKGGLYLDQDLSQLESVFSNIERQLDAIDEMKLMYELRVDTVIEYATRSPRTLGRDVTKLVKALIRHDKKHPQTCIRLPLVHQENLGESRLAQAKKSRIPPQPRKVIKSSLSATALQKSKRDRLANLAVRIDDTIVKRFIDNQMGARSHIESQELIANTIQDYFCLLAIHRAALFSKEQQKEFKSVCKEYNLSSTDDWIETDLLSIKKVIITRKMEIHHGA